MSIILHGIPNCDTVKKARKWLDEQGIPHEFRNYKTSPPTEAELSAWAKETGWEILLNKAGTTFRKLPEADKAGLDEAKAIALMVEHPSLIKRPVVTGAGTLLVGFKPDQWAAALKG